MFVWRDSHESVNLGAPILDEDKGHNYNRAN